MTRFYRWVDTCHPRIAFLNGAITAALCLAVLAGITAGVLL